MDILFGRNQSYTIDDVIISSNENQYEIYDHLGNGGNGSVYECMDLDGNEYAVKFLVNTSKKSVLRFEQELQLMKLAKHPHLMNYIDDGEVEAFDPKYHNTTKLKYIIMDKADGSLLDYLKSHNNIQYNIYAPQFRGLCEALAVLHKFAIHRDIKPENILIKGDTWILTDFGLCEFTSPELHKDITSVHEKVGPRFWMSPEAINDYFFELDETNKSSDVFQLCSVFAFVLMHRYPGGIIYEDDLPTTDPIKKIILDSLANNIKLRPDDGSVLAERFEKATLYIDFQN